MGLPIAIIVIGRSEVVYFNCEVPLRASPDRDDRFDKSAQKTREIFVFPLPGAAIAREGFFAAIKFLGMNATAARGIPFVGHDGMQHFVVKHILEKPARNEWLIEQADESE